MMKRGVDYIGVSVGAMVINTRRELFLSKRSQQVTNERGCWETPGGAVEFGETLEQAVLREFREEYSVQIEILKKYPAENHIIPREKQHWVATTFLAKIVGEGKPKIMERDKCEAIGWFRINHLPSPLSLITKLDIEHHKEDLD